MRRPVYISEVSFLAPGIEDVSQLLCAFDRLPNVSAPVQFSAEGVEIMLHHFNLDPTSTFYPSKKDLKSMRPDVSAAILCMGKLLENAAVGPDQMERAPLFIATGFCLDDTLNDQVNQACRAYLCKGPQDTAADQTFVGPY